MLLIVCLFNSGCIMTLTVLTGAGMVAREIVNHMGKKKQAELKERELQLKDRELRLRERAPVGALPEGAPGA